MNAPNREEKSLNIIMFGHKRIPSREGGVEIVVEELSTRMHGSFSISLELPLFISI